MYWAISILAFIAIRNLVKRFLFQPIGKHFGVNGSSKTKFLTDRIPPRSTYLLEQIYADHRQSSDKQIKDLATKLNLSTRDIHRWLRKRHNADKKSALSKFSERCWKLMSYAISLLIGVLVLYDEPWIWNMAECWTNYPNQKVSVGISLYYLYAVGFYGSCLLTHALKVRRRDYWEMLLHHVFTLGLIGSSWIISMAHVGAVVLLLHDCSNVFLEVEKFLLCIKKRRIAERFFLAYILTWVVTRLIIYPKKIIIEAAQPMVHILEPSLSYSIYGMLIGLFCLHVYWTYCIVRIYIAVLTDDLKNAKDTRSSTESDTSSD